MVLSSSISAQNLFVASSAVNRQVLRLEQEPGAELFDRVPSGMRLNAADNGCINTYAARCTTFT